MEWEGNEADLWRLSPADIVSEILSEEIHVVLPAEKTQLSRSNVEDDDLSLSGWRSENSDSCAEVRDGSERLNTDCNGWEEAAANRGEQSSGSGCRGGNQRPSLERRKRPSPGQLSQQATPRKPTLVAHILPNAQPGASSVSDPAARLSADKFRIEKLHMHHGLKDQDPLEHIFFYKPEQTLQVLFPPLPTLDVFPRPAHPSSLMCLAIGCT